MKPEIDDKDVVNRRHQEIKEKGHRFLKQVALNLCVPEGISGKIDLAFKIDRKKLVAEILRDVAKELEETEVKNGQRNQRKNQK